MGREDSVTLHKYSYAYADWHALAFRLNIIQMLDRAILKNPRLGYEVWGRKHCFSGERN